MLKKTDSDTKRHAATVPLVGHLQRTGGAFGA